MRRIRVGHIGWLSWDEGPECETVAWCDANQHKLKQSVAEHPQVATYTDYRDMLRHAGMDAVVISTPNEFHAEQAIAFLDAGVDVFLEKPMGVNKAECDAILQAAARSGRTLVIDFELRISLFCRRVRALIESGAYGELRRIEFFHHRGCWLEEGNGCWRVRPEKSGGFYFMEPIHEVDLFRLLGGEVRAVQSTSGSNVLPQYQFEDNVCSHFFFEGGALGTIVTSHTHSAWADKTSKWGDLGHDMALIVTLTQGSIGVDFIRQRILVNRFETYPAGTEGVRVVLDHVEDHAAAGYMEFCHDIDGMRREFIRRLAEGLQPVQDALGAWRTHRVCLAAEQSLKEDFRRVAVDYTLPEGCESLSAPAPAAHTLLFGRKSR